MNKIVQQNLIKKLNNKSAVIGIVGLGYVGLPLALCYSKAGFKVIGIEIDPKKVKSIKSGESYIKHIPSNEISDAIKNNFQVTDDFSKSSDCDALILCVPTPLDKHHFPDLSFVTNTLDALLPHLQEGQIVSLESTTYPGTTEEVLLPKIESRKSLKVGENIFLAYSPEREDPGNPHFNTQNIPKVCGGCTDNCLSVGVALYEQAIEKVVPVSSTRAAEMTKLLENIYRIVNIGLVNEMKIIADKMNIDIFEVINAAATKPFGYTAFYPGPGLGGHCIPIDPFYLTWKAKEFNIHTRFIELAGEINKNMPNWVVDKLIFALNKRKKAVNGSNILIMGVAYKKNIDDLRESPAEKLIELISELGGNINYADPYVNVYSTHDSTFTSVELNKNNISNYDAVLLVTDHDSFDYEMIKDHAKLIIDTRGRYSSNKNNNIVQA